ncbi:MAG: 16S rRNA processing protein RimM [Myxococcales bacterium]|nr:16S rRNA processing protein RimM [Myxococcales bacterium]
MTSKNKNWVAMARIGRPHGVRGELKVQPFNPNSTLIFEVEELRITRKGKPPELLQLESARPGGDLWIVRVEGVESRDEAGKLTHGILSVKRETLPDLEPGEFYHFDVVGAEVFDADSGDKLGVVRHVHDGANELLEIRLTAGGDVLIPIMESYVTSIGQVPGRVEVRDLDHWQA